MKEIKKALKYNEEQEIAIWIYRLDENREMIDNDIVKVMMDRYALLCETKAMILKRLKNEIKAVKDNASSNDMNLIVEADIEGEIFEIKDYKLKGYKEYKSNN
tara:strand:+ start:208 stop:516 length:309 start_codon:yes stop_codon:yes gene_type:complete